MPVFPPKKQWTNLSIIDKWVVISAMCTSLGVIVGLVILLIPKDENPSISDLVMIDANPTNVLIEKVDFKNYLGDEEEFLTIHLENQSERTASSLKVSLRGAKERWVFPRTKSTNAFENGISLIGGNKIQIPVAPKSLFDKKFSKHCSSCILIHVGQRPIPLELKKKICEVHLKSEYPCSNTTQGFPFLIETEYKTIFSSLVKNNLVMFAYYLKSKGSK